MNFQGIGTSIAKKPYDFFSGGGGEGGGGVVCTFVVCMQQGKVFSRRGRLIVNIFKICFL